jgi:hypothetical protein
MIQTFERYRRGNKQTVEVRHVHIHSGGTVAAMLGHRGGTMTSRYQHVADAVLLKAADAVAGETARLMGESQPESAVIPLRG